MLYNSTVFLIFSLLYMYNIATSCNHGDVRLYGGYTRADGAAEVCINGLWANICYQNWDETDSRIFCKQLLGHENIGT